MLGVNVKPLLLKWGGLDISEYQYSSAHCEKILGQRWTEADEVAQDGEVFSKQWVPDSTRKRILMSKFITYAIPGGHTILLFPPIFIPTTPTSHALMTSFLPRRNLKPGVFWQLSNILLLLFKRPSYKTWKEKHYWHKRMFSWLLLIWACIHLRTQSIGRLLSFLRQ